MRKLAVSVLLFVAVALVGPLIRWITWPPSKFEQGTSASVGNFVSDLVFLLWPTQPLAVMEVDTGSFVAGVVAVIANIVLFGLVGAAVDVVAKWRFGLVAGYFLVGILVVLLAFWGAGFSLTYLNTFSLVVALLLYAIPFWATSRFT